MIAELLFGAVRAGGRTEHRKPSWSHTDYAVYLSHTHAYVYQQVRSDGRQLDVEIYPPFAHRTAEQSLVGLTKARHGDVICG